MNKPDDFRCNVVEHRTQIAKAVVSDDNHYIYFTMPVSIYFNEEDAWYENGDDYVGLNVYIHDDSITTKPQNANYAQTECQFRYCGTAIPFLTVRSTAR